MWQCEAFSVQKVEVDAKSRKNGYTVFSIIATFIHMRKPTRPLHIVLDAAFRKRWGKLLHSFSSKIVHKAVSREKKKTSDKKRFGDSGRTKLVLISSYSIRPRRLFSDGSSPFYNYLRTTGRVKHRRA